MMWYTLQPLCNLFRAAVATQVAKEMASCKGPFTRSDFKDPILSSENWTQAFRWCDFKVELVVMDSVIIC